MRIAEIALLILPLAMLVAWFMGIRGLSRSGTIAAAIALIATACLLFWLGEGRSVRGRYVPAQLQNGRVVPESGTTDPR